MEPKAGRFTFEGLSLYYEEFGEGDDVVVYLHGLLLDSCMNRGLARAIASTGRRRVVLLDLAGHGRSDKPLHAGAYRMDLFGRQVVALLDHLGVDTAILGGVSLGANVSLQVAVAFPERVRALILEMPVLEIATPGAALVFVPLLLLARFARPVVGAVTGLVRRLPRPPHDAARSVMESMSTPPEVIAAVLHGILVGPVAPSIEDRKKIDVPVLVLAHPRDFIHPFSDAENIVSQLQDARLVEAKSLLELRLTPNRLTREIVSFVDEVASRPRAQLAAACS
ncbi:MAG: alpha/beta hydrolase [Acidimicrobiales bacterium]|nr:MAG: alpha/beta hydrolase [Acidimicrobiales bacterium]